MFRNIALLLMLIAPLAFADYHYASHSGSNTYPYTSWETAADSIGAAMRAAEPYDTVYIGAGDYNEIMIMSAADSCITFIGAGMDSTRCWTDSLHEIWMVGNRTVADGIWFQEYHDRFCFTARTFFETVIAKSCKFTGGAGIGGCGDSVVAENCQFLEEYKAVDAAFGVRKLLFRNNYFRTTQFPVAFSVIFSKAIIENSIFIYDHYQPNGEFFADPGPVDTLIFINNYIDNFTAGVDIVGTRLGEISNNTVRRALRWYERQSFAISDGGARDTVNVILRNNAATESGYGVYALHFGNYVSHLSIGYTGFYDNPYGEIVSYNWSWNNIDTIGNIHAYPMYTGPDSFDVRLQAYSPFINTGDPLILDVDGTRSDIGVFGGPGGSYCQYQDLPPRKPDGLTYRISGDSLKISWRKNYEADFWRYLINRDTISNFTPWAGNIISEPDTNYFVDFNWDNQHDYYYKIASYDNQGNLSPYSSELAVHLTGINDDNSGVEIPNISAIESSYPNPFNSSTTIVYTVANLGPIPAQINIDIYDIGGRRVRGLLDSREEVGRHSIIWDGLDDSGNALSSGIYFAKITQWHVDYLSNSQKLILVR